MAASEESRDLARLAAQVGEAKSARGIVAFDVSERLGICDIFLVMSANNERLVDAIVDDIDEKLDERGRTPLRREGRGLGRWVLLDYGDLVIHVQHEEERVLYSLERLWRDCPTVDCGIDAEPAVSLLSDSEVSPLEGGDHLDGGDDSLGEAVATHESGE